MSETSVDIKSSTRRLKPEFVALLRSLNAGDKIRITQTVRVGRRKWTTTVDGVFRNINYLATGVTTDRVPEDDVIVPMVHFTKTNGELASIAIDDRSVIERA